jgi:predicted RNA-binding protein with PIN domain
MTQRLWIDGYNLIGHLGLTQQGSLDSARARMLGLLSGRKLRVYFDARTGGLPEQRGALEIVFTRAENADERIVRDLRALGVGTREVTLVTNDRELAGRCRQLGAAHTSCAAFVDSLPKLSTPRDMQREAADTKRASMTRSELEELQRIFETPRPGERPSSEPPGPRR